jgi:hypothetical protein
MMTAVKLPVFFVGSETAIKTSEVCGILGANEGR